MPVTYPWTHFGLLAAVPTRIAIFHTFLARTVASLIYHTINMLQYASLKAVLQYLDANIRFQIYNRYPSIRKTERAVPLHISRLTFLAGEHWPNRIYVNSIAYSIGTVCVYPADAKIPYEHDVKNKNGGVGSDLDRFGFEDYTSDSHLTPGDIRVGRPRTPWSLDENKIDEFVRELKALNMLLALKRTGRPFILDREHPQYFIMQYFENQKAKAIRKYIRGRTFAFSPYLNRRNNITVPFTTEVQITVKSGREAQKVHRYPGKKVYQVEKKLLTLFFGSRKHIYVKHLEIYGAGMFRFPINMYIKIQHLHMSYYTFQMLYAISQFVHPHAIVKSPRKSYILGSFGDMSTLLEVATHEVEVVWPDFDLEDYLILARNWLETRRTVGTCYVFNFEDVTVVDEVLRLLETELNAEVVEAECLKVRINETSKLKIAYQKVEEQWRMQFKVISE